MRLLHSADLVKVVFFVALATTNPFGMTDAFSELSRDVMMRATAGSFSRLRPSSSAVVLIDDVSIRIRSASTQEGESTQFQGTADRAYIAELLRNLLAQDVKAVFLDFLFIGQATGTEELVAAIQEASAIGVPVFIASSPGEGERAVCEDLTLPEIAAAAHGSARVARQDHALNRYALMPEPCKTGGVVVNSSAAPALVLYRELCARRPAACNDPGTAEESAPWKDEIILRWGNAPTAAVKEVRASSQSCPQEAPADIWDDVSYFFASVHRDLRTIYAKQPIQEKPRYPCYPTPTLFAWEVMSEHVSMINAVSRVLADRTVFVGNALIGLNDHGLSPVFELTPGVVMHATAFDNLVAFGGNYVRPWENIAFNFDGDDCLELLLLLGLLALNIDRKHEGAARRWRRLVTPPCDAANKTPSGSSYPLPSGVRAKHSKALPYRQSELGRLLHDTAERWKERLHQGFVMANSFPDVRTKPLKGFFVLKETVVHLARWSLVLCLLVSTGLVFFLQQNLEPVNVIGLIVLAGLALEEKKVLGATLLFALLLI